MGGGLLHTLEGTGPAPVPCEPGAWEPLAHTLPQCWWRRGRWRGARRGRAASPQPSAPQQARGAPPADSGDCAVPRRPHIHPRQLPGAHLPSPAQRANGLADSGPSIAARHRGHLEGPPCLGPGGRTTAPERVARAGPHPPWLSGAGSGLSFRRAPLTGLEGQGTHRQVGKGEERGGEGRAGAASSRPREGRRSPRGSVPPRAQEGPSLLWTCLWGRTAGTQQPPPPAQGPGCPEPIGAGHAHTLPANPRRWSHTPASSGPSLSQAGTFILNTPRKKPPCMGECGGQARGDPVLQTGRHLAGPAS